MSDISEFAKVGTEVALGAGKLLMKHFRTDFAVAHKGDVNLVTEIDIAAEELIVSRILEAFPSHAILAEEGHSEAKRDAHTWIVDPLDGTTNYAHGFPIFCVSIALEIDGKLEWGAVYNPNLEELFSAQRGRGARLNEEPIQVSRVSSLNSSLLATGFPYDIRTSEQNNLDYFREFALRAQAVRRAGSAALDLCYVAAGRFDGFWELKLSPWDCAAGYLVVREAGGRVTLGVGVGARRDDYDASELPFAGRGARLSQQIEALRARWEDPANGPAPVQDGGPPILVGGLAGPAYARMAALGDGYIHAGGPPRAFARAVEQARAAWADAGRSELRATTSQAPTTAATRIAPTAPMVATKRGRSGVAYLSHPTSNSVVRISLTCAFNTVMVLASVRRSFSRKAMFPSIRPNFCKALMVIATVRGLWIRLTNRR